MHQGKFRPVTVPQQPALTRFASRGRAGGAFGRCSPTRGRWHRMAFWCVQWSLYLLTIAAAIRAFVDPALELGAREALAIGTSASFIVLAPFLVLRHERRTCELLEKLVARLSAAHRDQVAAARDRVVAFTWLIVLVPIALVIWAYLAAPEYFANVLGLGALPDPLAVATVVVLSVGGLSAGFGVAAALGALVLCIAVARVPDEWEPFTESAGYNAEVLANFATASSRYFSLAGATLLPGVVAVSAGVRGDGFLALLAIALLIGGLASALLIIPAWAVHRGSTRDKATYVGQLSEEIRPLAEALMSEQRNEGADQQQNYYRLRALLEIRLQVVSQRASPASVDLLQRLPGSIVAPALAVLLRLG
jgi:hypothetical protein